jgi:ATP-dependent RNA helicase DDX52/ROK1
VEARRPAKEADGKLRAKTRISTKSGWERRVEHNRKGAVVGSRMRKGAGEDRGDRAVERRLEEGGEESEFEGFD